MEVPPRELVFEDAIHVGVREVLEDLVELVELRVALLFSAARAELIREAPTDGLAITMPAPGGGAVPQTAVA